MRTQALMFKEMLFKMGVYTPESSYNELPDIPPITNVSKISSSYDSAPPTYQHLNNTAIIKKESTTNTDSPKKYLVALLKMITATNKKT